jgi:hypothetical protein
MAGVELRAMAAVAEARAKIAVNLIIVVEVVACGVERLD